MDERHDRKSTLCTLWANRKCLAKWNRSALTSHAAKSENQIDICKSLYVWWMCDGANIHCVLFAGARCVRVCVYAVRLNGFPINLTCDQIWRGRLMEYFRIATWIPIKYFDGYAIHRAHNGHAIRKTATQSTYTCAIIITRRTKRDRIRPSCIALWYRYGGTEPIQRGISFGKFATATCCRRRVSRFQLIDVIWLHYVNVRLWLM